MFSLAAQRQISASISQIKYLWKTGMPLKKNEDFSCSVSEKLVFLCVCACFLWSKVLLFY